MPQPDLFGGSNHDRLSNGVRARRDDQGEPWAEAHRLELGNLFYLQDMDAFMGHIAFARTGAGEIFAEYVPDAWKHRESTVRNFGLVAMFDRKRSKASVFGRTNRVSLGFYLHLCRVVGRHQPVHPKFFFVVGDAPPWEMVQVNIDTGEPGAVYRYGPGQWSEVWDAAGLIMSRLRLKKWLETGVDAP